MSWGEPLRYAARGLRRHPRHSLPTIALLGLALGAAGAAYSLLHSVLLRPLPYADPDRLAMVWTSTAEAPAPYVVSWPEYLDWRRESRSFISLAAFNIAEEQLNGPGDPETVSGAAVTGDFFSTLGVVPFAGHFFEPGDPDRPQRGVVVLSHALWRRRFGGSTAILGHTVLLSGSPAQVIGIAPPELRQPEPLGAPEAELWVPLSPQPWFGERGARTLRVVGRLRRGTGLRAAQAEMSSLARRLAVQHPDDDHPRILVVQLHRQLTGGLRPGLGMLAVAMAALLLVALANAGNQVLVHRLHRERELQVRFALGAGRGTLVAEILGEGLLLGLGSGALGVVLGAWGGGLLARTFPVHVAGIEGLRYGLAAAWLTLALGLGGGLLVMVPSLLHLAAPTWDRALRLQGMAPSGRRIHALRGALLIGEVVLALPLVVAASLLTQSFARLQQVDPGFDPAGVTTFRLTLPAARYSSRQQQLAFYDLLRTDLSHLPGVQAAGLAAVLPLTGFNDREFDLIAEGRGDRNPPGGKSVHYQLISPGFLEALRIPILAGRPFGGADGATGERVAIVNRSLAERLWPGQEPVGRRLSFDYGAGQAPRWMTVVGVARDVRLEGLTDPPTPILYRPLGQDVMEILSVVVRSRLAAQALVPRLEAAVWRYDPRLPLTGLEPLQHVVDAQAADLRFLSRLLAVVAAVALAVTVLGVASLMSYLASSRRQEVAIRVALGARPADVRALLVRPVLGLLAIGTVCGLLAALGARELLAHLLYGIQAEDAATLGGCAAAILAAGALAAWLPARTACRFDPRAVLQPGDR